MPSPLEKARQNPKSMKARILASARRIFGRYSYNNTTTRMIAKDVGIDISTLYYHWGEKQDLYEAVLEDVGDEIQHKPPASIRFVPIKHALALTVEPFKFSPA